jgi:PPR repeat./Tetratricopeptide repeat.
MAQTSRNKPGVEEFGTSGTTGSGDLTMFKMQDSFDKNKKLIIGLVVAVLVLVGGYFGYKYLVQAPNEEKANRALYKVQNWFEADSSNLVINGDGQSTGALNIVKKYSGTDAANLAKYYLGMSYLKTGDANNAIKYLGEFDGKGTVVGNLANGSLGDAYMETGKLDKALEYYKKAAANENDQYTSALYTFRAALANEKAGKTEEAKKLYKEIKEKYPMSQQATEINKYLARTGELTVD